MSKITTLLKDVKTEMNKIAADVNQLEKVFTQMEEELKAALPEANKFKLYCKFCNTICSKFRTLLRAPIECMSQT